MAVADIVYDTIKAYLQDPNNVIVLTGPEGVPTIRFENEPFDMPNPPAPWFAFSMTGTLYEQVSIGASLQKDNRWDETGFMWIPVFVPSGSGVSRARALAKGMADIFRGLELLNTLEFLEAHIGEGGPARETGNWYELPLTIKFRMVEA